MQCNDFLVRHLVIDRSLHLLRVGGGICQAFLADGTIYDRLVGSSGTWFED
jgi:hypothetical protein